jgi:hypothetical protein
VIFGIRLSSCIQPYIIKSTFSKKMFGLCMRTWKKMSRTVVFERFKEFSSHWAQFFSSCVLPC